MSPRFECHGGIRTELRSLQALLRLVVLVLLARNPCQEQAALGLRHGARWSGLQQDAFAGRQVSASQADARFEERHFITARKEPVAADRFQDLLRTLYPAGSPE